MAKKKVTPPPVPESTPTAELSAQDRQTLDKIRSMGNAVMDAAERRRDPSVDVPSRSLSNVRYNKTQRIIEMGKGTNKRQLFNLNQAKSYMQTMLVGAGCKSLIEQGKSNSIRGLYYQLKHSIAGTKEDTFADQAECDPIIEDVEVLLQALREELHLFASNRGALIGNLTFNDSGDTIDATRLGSGGYSIPSICEPGVIDFVKCEATFILHVEKDTVWRRFNEDKFWKKYNCILTHGGGQPSRGVRRLLHRLHNELNLPVYCLLDNDPYGYYIYSVIKQGSINLAHESKRMAIPEAKYLGLRSIDLERCSLSDSVKINLTENDRRRAKQIAKYPWFEGKARWQREIAKLIENDFKLEVEALVSKSISYVTETYVPERLETQDWLD